VPVATAGVAMPTAPIAPTDAVAQVVAPPPATVPQVAASAATEDAGLASGQIWFGITALVLLISAGIGLLVVQRRAQ
jgi:hypothetical protein